MVDKRLREGEFNRKKEKKKKRNYLVVNYSIFASRVDDRKRICTTFKMSYKY